MTTPIREPLTNGLGETFYRVTLWSHLALDHVAAHVWAHDAYAAGREALADLPAGTARVVSVRFGFSGDLD